ncbi:hypothetical protein PUN28_013678 [Cardiocondyla obscurior]|uniref:Uncharacterized protein n=1 Tax=Cardiocondyla obscurior TaxID=286306 RepID=A0AAW2F6K6_9HYME
MINELLTIFIILTYCSICKKLKKKKLYSAGFINGILIKSQQSLKQRTYILPRYYSKELLPADKVKKERNLISLTSNVFTVLIFAAANEIFLSHFLFFFFFFFFCARLLLHYCFIHFNL